MKKYKLSFIYLVRCSLLMQFLLKYNLYFNSESSYRNSWVQLNILQHKISLKINWSIYNYVIFQSYEIFILNFGANLLFLFNIRIITWFLPWCSSLQIYILIYYTILSVCPVYSIKLFSYIQTVFYNNMSYTIIYTSILL